MDALQVNDFLSIDLPESPGIYQFYDNKERLLYIGKAKNLKKRVQTYFRKQNAETRERTLIMINSIRRVQFIPTETELEALLLEDKLIKEFLPPYNVKQKKFREQVYLTITADLFPAFLINNNQQIHFGQRIFGPFKDKYAAENIISLLNQTLKLRSCSEPHPKNKCLLAGIGKCFGPCVNGIAPSEYEAVVAIAVEFLSGNPEPIVEIMQEQLASAARNLDFEKAAEWRDWVEYCHNFCRRQKFLQNFIHKNAVIRNNKFSFIFRKGELIRVYKQFVSEEQLKKNFAKPAEEQKNLPHLLDRAYVVWVWLKQKKATGDFYE